MKKSLTRFILYDIFSSHMPEILIQWHGTDVGKLYQFLPGMSKMGIVLYRWFWRRMTKLTNLTCLMNTPRMFPILKEFGFKRIEYREAPWAKKRYDVKEYVTSHLVILFYIRQKFNLKYENWIYGKDYLLALKKNMPEVEWLLVTGDDDMRKIYPHVDCYIKINRMPHSDRNKINKECEYNDIPERAFDVWNKTFEESIKEITEWINTNRDIWFTNKENKGSF